MTTEFNHLDGEERIKAENEYLKMKLMLERGAEFMSSGDDVIHCEIENEFLNNIIAFEEQFGNRKTIQVFDKLGRPDHFKPASELTDEEVDAAWQMLRSCLNEHQIDLGVCSPNVSKRELYRFVLEEFFFYEMDDMDMPGWLSHFIYDEFYPDTVYENSKMVRDELFKDIFGQGEICCEYSYDSAGFVFNNTDFKEFSLFRQKIDFFKSLYESMELNHCNIDHCAVENEYCDIRGQYRATAGNGNLQHIYEGGFHVRLKRSDTGFWLFKNIQIEGFMPWSPAVE